MNIDNDFLVPSDVFFAYKDSIYLNRNSALSTFVEKDGKRKQGKNESETSSEKAAREEEKFRAREEERKVSAQHTSKA